eukprot:gnl/TRDRNA2_/TRDRNA2_198080_c0_seq1.p1 gnl/TRDRNA2_/TRDRNA2_198080_c0~~gnl/TRDRNA2_/TRDRNA2_198080_c0_seq1.p1  ORF type:complete len:342 (-),score=43.32 gnl/TRDRNA2_/TRDRNA2_198080_c0_seq1:145-1131(-)
MALVARYFTVLWLLTVASEASDAHTMKVKLNTGAEMPLISLGTAGYNDSTVEEAVVLAVDVGFRGIDAAFNYYNQAGVGKGLKRVNRSAMFIVTKTSPCLHSQAPPRYNITDVAKCQEQTRRDIETNFKQLDVAEIDLLLLHGANHFGAGGCGELACRLNVAQWQVYEEYFKAGTVKAIGVSNYCPSCLDCILSATQVVPAVNQLKYHPGMTKDPEGVWSYCRRKGIVPMAYSPMGSGEIFTDSLLMGIAASHNKTAAQVALKWIVDKGYTLATKTNNRQHLMEDLDLFSWSLTADETASIDSYSKGDDVPSWACTAMESSESSAIIV